MFADEVIRKHVAHLSFVDIGGLLYTVNEKVTVALGAGAASATMADITPLWHELWTSFDQRAAEAGFSGYGKICVSVDDPELDSKLGVFDFVHCSGVVYHCPAPSYTIERLAKVTRRYLLLGSMVVPEHVSNQFGTVDFTAGNALFVPAVDERKRAVMAEHFRQSGLEIMHFNHADPEPFLVDGRPNYSPWWWLYSAQTMKRMIETGGFHVIADASIWDSRAHYYFCEKEDHART